MISNDSKQQLKLLVICFAFLLLCVLGLTCLYFAEKQSDYEKQVQLQNLEQLKIQNELEKERLLSIKREQELKQKQIDTIAAFIEANKSSKSTTDSTYLSNRIIFWANTWNIQPEFLASLICAESNFYKYAKSHMNCRGLGQASKETWDWFNESYVWHIYSTVWRFENDVYDIDKNLQFTCWYINKLQEYDFLNNDLYKVLIAYNCGPYSSQIKRNIKYWGYSDKILKMTDSLLG